MGKTPAFAFSNDSQAYLEAFADVLEKIPGKENRISFEQDTWDFNPYFHAVNSDSLRFPFAFCPEEIRNYAKFFDLCGEDSGGQTRRTCLFSMRFLS